MELLGEANWWMPRWLDAAVPRLSFDREPVSAETADQDVEPLPALVGR